MELQRRSNILVVGSRIWGLRSQDGNNLASFIERLKYKAYNPMLSRWLRELEIDRANAFYSGARDYIPDYNVAFHEGGQMLKPSDSDDGLALLHDQTVSAGGFVSCESLDKYQWVRAASMYEGWTSPPRFHYQDHVVGSDTVCPVGSEYSAAVAFDTWGITSYYHLLIDTVIPLWATKLFLSDVYKIDTFKDPVWWQISNNGSEEQLKSTQDIFNFFLGSPAKSSPNLVAAEVCYGYLSGCRPYLGPRYKFELRPWVKYYMDRFRDQFISKDSSLSSVILVPKRNDRLMSFVPYFVDKYSDRYEFKEIDFGAMDVSEQIFHCGSAAGMFGAEGAAFSNQVFLHDGSLVAPVSNKRHKFLFHKPLSLYCGHHFVEVLSRESVEYKSLEYECLNSFDNFFEMR